MITSKFSVIAILIITGICFGVLYIHIWKRKGKLLWSVLFILELCLCCIWYRSRLAIFCIYAGSCGCISCDVCTGQKKHLSENISCSDILFYPLACGCNGRQNGWFYHKSSGFGNTIAGRQWLQYVLYAGTRILDIVLCIVFLAVAIGLINKAYVYKNDEMSVKELVMLIIPSLVGVTGYGILQYYLNIYEKIQERAWQIPMDFMEL